MDLSEMSLEQALQKGVITKSSWNSPDWEVIENEWRKALSFAKKHHAEAGSTYVDKSKEVRAGNETPYISYIQKLLKILINEVHIANDNTLAIAALYNVLSLTDCEVNALEQEFDLEIVDGVKHLDMIKNMTFEEQLTNLIALESPQNSSLTYIFLAVKLLDERVTDICPFDSWETDIPYYKKMREQLEQFGIKVYRAKKWNIAIFIGTKILEQIEKNMKCSMNCNKTSEELLDW